MQDRLCLDAIRERVPDTERGWVPHLKGRQPRSNILGVADLDRPVIVGLNHVTECRARSRAIRTSATPFNSRPYHWV